MVLGGGGCGRPALGRGGPGGTGGGDTTQVVVASAFGVDDATLRRWARAWEAEGVAGLVPERKGPRRRSKLTEERIARIGELRAGGATLAAIAEATGLSVDSVRTGLSQLAAPAPALGTGGPGGALVPLAEPAGRSAEREPAAAGLVTAGLRQRLYPFGQPGQSRARERPAIGRAVLDLLSAKLIIGEETSAAPGRTTVGFTQDLLAASKARP